MSKFRDACLKALKESHDTMLQLGGLTNGQESYWFVAFGNNFDMLAKEYIISWHDKEGGQTDYTYHSFDEICKEWISLKNKGFKEVNK